MSTLRANRSGTSDGVIAVAAQEPETLLAGSASGPNDRRPDPAHAGELRLLLVEDNPQDAALHTAMLRATALSELFDVVVAGRLADCVTAVAREKPACILLDLGLPDAAGVEGLDRLRIVAPDVPVVVLTGTDDEAVGSRRCRVAHRTTWSRVRSTARSWRGRSATQSSACSQSSASTFLPSTTH